MKITVQDLQKQDACEEGIEAFSAIFPEGWDGEWTPMAQAMILGSPLKRFFGWAYRHGLIPIWSMNSWDLRGADLYGADLRSANLEGADLRWASLKGANLEGAIGVKR